jgi:uncharacterized protein YjbI with pentapeptide repeats
MKIKLLITLFIVSMIFFSCGGEHSSTQTSSFKESDTTNIPELINFISQQQIDSIIDLETGINRYKGIKSVPQDSDDFRREQLDKTFWNGVVTRNSDFRGASFRSAKCDDSDFSGSDFRVADIRWSMFDRANLTNCNFDQARLFHVHVNYADLTNSTFRGTNMFGMEGHFAILRNCDLSGALLKDTEFLHSDFTGSKAIKSNFIRAVLKKSKLDSIDFSYSNFTGAGLEESTFINANLRHVNFQGGHLQGADFSGADLYGCNFFGTELESTNFKGAKNIPEEIKPFINKDGLATGIWQDMKQTK